MFSTGELNKQITTYKEDKKYMGDITSGSTIVEAMPSQGRRIITVETASTTDTADTVDVVLATYGLTEFWGIEGYVHTTANSVVVAEAPTTSVTTGTLTITVGGSTVSDKKRFNVIYGK